MFRPQKILKKKSVKYTIHWPIHICYTVSLRREVQEE